MTTSLSSLTAAVLAAGAAILLAPAPGRAEIEYPWCAMTSTGQSGLPACLYSTLAQCQAFLAGQAGSCVRNARIVAREQAVKRGAK